MDEKAVRLALASQLRRYGMVSSRVSDLPCTSDRWKGLILAAAQDLNEPVDVVVGPHFCTAVLSRDGRDVVREGQLARLLRGSGREASGG